MTSTAINPIQTRFDGILFRSRTEARWAVVFKTLGLAYQYEPEGYDIEGRWYLPDFYIPEWRAFCEVKPFGEPAQETKELMNVLSAKTGIKSCVLAGQPGAKKYQVWPTVEWVLSPDGQPLAESYGVLGQCRRCPGIWLLAPDGDTSYWGVSISCKRECDDFKYSNDQYGELGKAMNAGAACRFDNQNE